MWFGRRRGRKQTQVGVRPMRLAPRRLVAAAQLRQTSWTWRHAEYSSAPIAPQVTILQRLHSRAKPRMHGFARRTSFAVRPRLARHGRPTLASTTVTLASSIATADQTVVRTGGARQLARIWSVVASGQLHSGANSQPYQRSIAVRYLRSTQTLALMFSVFLKITGTPPARPCAWA